MHLVFVKNDGMNCDLLCYQSFIQISFCNFASKLQKLIMLYEENIINFLFHLHGDEFDKWPS